MKHFIAAITILFSSFTFAMSEDSIFVTENEFGGQIFLLSNECPLDGSKGARISIMTVPGAVIYGCWFFYQGHIYAIWFLNETTPIKRQYDPEDFRLEKTL